MDGVLYNLRHHGVAHMADMHSAPGCPGHVNHIFSGNILGPHIMGIQEIPDFLFAGPSGFCLCLLFPFKHLTELFTVETAQGPVRL